MAKSANPGMMSTRIRVYRPVKTVGADGRTSITWALVTPQDGVHCKWVNSFGVEALQANQFGLVEPATITMRFVRGVAPDCEVEKITQSGGERYEIITLNNVDDRSAWLEIKVQRKVEAI